MARGVLEIVNIPDNTIDDDDEIAVLYSTPAPIKKGTSKFDAIPVEDYSYRAKRAIDLSQNSSHFDAEVELLYSFSKARKRISKGESSNTKSATEIQTSVPLIFLCEICADEKPISDLFRVPGCDHSYCSWCIGKYVASKLQENISSISCPVLGCNGFLKPHHCRAILPKRVFDRWGDALCESLILASEKFYCPYKDCSAFLIYDRVGNEVIMQSECPDCNRLFCVQCKVPWHSGIDCLGFQNLKEDERSNEDIMLINLAKNNKWMRCPKCKFYVDKSEGCLFMKCRCGHSFCYNCGAPLKEHYCRICKR